MVTALDKVTEVADAYDTVLCIDLMVNIVAFKTVVYRSDFVSARAIDTDVVVAY